MKLGGNKMKLEYLLLWFAILIMGFAWFLQFDGTHWECVEEKVTYEYQISFAECALWSYDEWILWFPNGVAANCVIQTIGYIYSEEKYDLRDLNDNWRIKEIEHRQCIKEQLVRDIKGNS